MRLLIVLTLIGGGTAAMVCAGRRERKLYPPPVDLSRYRHPIGDLGAAAFVVGLLIALLTS